MSGTGTLSDVVVTGTATSGNVVVIGTTTSTNVITDTLYAKNSLSVMVPFTGGAFASANNTLRTPAVAIWRLGDTPPTRLIFAFTTSGTTASTIFVSATEPTRGVTLASSTTSILVNTTAVQTVTLTLTGTQFTALSDSYYTISVNFDRASGNGTITAVAVALSVL